MTDEEARDNYMTCLTREVESPGRLLAVMVDILMEMRKLNAKPVILPGDKK